MHSYNVLLHLCAGGNQGEEGPKRFFPREATEVRARLAVAIARASFAYAQTQVYNRMLSRNVQPLEMTYTALARVTASSGDPAHAYQLVCAPQVSSPPVLTPSLQTKDMRAKGVLPRLRTFSPALAGFCKALELERVSYLRAFFAANH